VRQSTPAKEIRAAAATASTSPDAKPMPAATDRATADAPAQPRSGEPGLAATAQLEISSTPNGADIEIDGNYVGSTPSTVGATAGQHQISLKKSGFKAWERKITVSTGQIKVNGALESEEKQRSRGSPVRTVFLPPCKCGVESHRSLPAAAKSLVELDHGNQLVGLRLRQS
jgi:PEGA domain